MVTRRRVEVHEGSRPRAVDPAALRDIEAEIAKWPEEEARMAMLVIGSWLAGDRVTLQRAWLRLSPFQIGWLNQVLNEIDPGLPRS